MRKKRISEFADKWLAKFQDQSLNEIALAEDLSFSDECFELKFEMDCGNGFCKKYGIQYLSDAVSVLDKVEDIDYLASAIFSYWRYFNHWAYMSSEILDNREWFIATLTRLKELTNS